MQEPELAASGAKTADLRFAIQPKDLEKVQNHGPQATLLGAPGLTTRNKKLASHHCFPSPETLQVIIPSEQRVSCGSGLGQ